MNNRYFIPLIGKYEGKIGRLVGDINFEGNASGWHKLIFEDRNKGMYSRNEIREIKINDSEFNLLDVENIEDYKIDIFQYSDMLKIDIVVHRYADQNNRYSAKFEGAGVKDGIFMISESGEAKTFIDAVNDYSRKISGKVIIFEMRGDRYKVPLLKPIR